MPTTHNAILLAAFGSRLPGAEDSLGVMRACAQELYPDWRVETAFTSGTVRRHKGAHSRQGRSPGEVLRQLVREGVRRLAVQSLHVVPGDEFLGLQRLVASMRGGPDGFERIELGRPLLGNAARMCAAPPRPALLCPDRRAQGEVELAYGHGTRGNANSGVQDLADELRAWIRRC
jgi:sirohydrochlorin cobaltochelatase